MPWAHWRAGRRRSPVQRGWGGHPGPPSISSGVGLILRSLRSPRGPRHRGRRDPVLHRLAWCVH